MEGRVGVLPVVTALGLVQHRAPPSPPPHGTGAPGSSRDAHKHTPCVQADSCDKDAGDKGVGVNVRHLYAVLTKVDVAVAEVAHEHVTSSFNIMSEVEMGERERMKEDGENQNKKKHNKRASWHSQ